MFTVATNAGRRRLGRLARSRPVAEVPEQTARPADGWDPDLVAAVRPLPTRQRQAVALRYVADLTQADVADVDGRRPRHRRRPPAPGPNNLRQTLGGPDHG